jgi:hypothetical protein
MKTFIFSTVLFFCFSLISNASELKKKKSFLPDYHTEFILQNDGCYHLFGVYTFDAGGGVFVDFFIPLNQNNYIGTTVMGCMEDFDSFC